MTTITQWNERVRRRLKLRDIDILLSVIQTGSMGKGRPSTPTAGDGRAKWWQRRGIATLAKGQSARPRFHED